MTREDFLFCLLIIFISTGFCMSLSGIILAYIRVLNLIDLLWIFGVGVGLFVIGGVLAIISILYG